MQINLNITWLYVHIEKTIIFIVFSFWLLYVWKFLEIQDVTYLFIDICPGRTSVYEHFSNISISIPCSQMKGIVSWYEFKNHLQNAQNICITFIFLIYTS